MPDKCRSKIIFLLSLVILAIPVVCFAITTATVDPYAVLGKTAIKNYQGFKGSWSTSYFEGATLSVRVFKGDIDSQGNPMRDNDGFYNIWDFNQQYWIRDPNPIRKSQYFKIIGDKTSAGTWVWQKLPFSDPVEESNFFGGLAQKDQITVQVYVRSKETVSPPDEAYASNTFTYDDTMLYPGAAAPTVSLPNTILLRSPINGTKILSPEPIKFMWEGASPPYRLEIKDQFTNLILRSITLENNYASVALGDGNYTWKIEGRAASGQQIESQIFLLNINSGGPKVEAEVIKKGQIVTLKENQVLSFESALKAYITDGNGINLLGIKILVDGREQQSSIQKISDKSAILSTNLSFKEGFHKIEILASDNEGKNNITKYAGLQVYSDIKLLSAPQNEPDPVPISGDTSIIYDLSTDADIEILIYDDRRELISTKQHPAGTPGAIAGENKVRVSFAGKDVGSYTYTIKSGNQVLGKGRITISP